MQGGLSLFFFDCGQHALTAFLNKYFGLTTGKILGLINVKYKYLSIHFYTMNSQPIRLDMTEPFFNPFANPLNFSYQIFDAHDNFN
ncbi:hypothetical protein DAMA08_048250 [Martiniozyma asiatica (nom. inval.)]|nr:hypothetical protein DAMA08_048250 [Martiniozyma asiatica]